MNNKTVLIAGSTGLVGREVLKGLLNDDEYSTVYSLVRRPGKLFHPKLKEVVINFGNISEEIKNLHAIDEIFCCLGTTIKVAGSKEAFREVDYHYPLELAKWGKQKNVKHFLMITAMGADPNSSIFYNKVKGEAERDISALGLIATTYFRPSLLLGNREESRPGEKVGIAIAKALSFLFIGPLKNYRAISVVDVANAMIKASKSNSKGLSIVLSGSM